MSDADLRPRTKQFALRTVRLFGWLPKTSEAQIIGKQLLRSGTSVAANYRESCRARSTAEMVSKLGMVEQELDESILWLEYSEMPKLFTLSFCVTFATKPSNC